MNGATLDKFLAAIPDAAVQVVLPNEGLRMLRVIVISMEDQRLVVGTRPRRLTTVSGLLLLVAFAWLLALVPPVVGFVFAVATAVAWCSWLEKHPQTDKPAGVP